MHFHHAVPAFPTPPRVSKVVTAAEAQLALGEAGVHLTGPASKVASLYTKERLISRVQRNQSFITNRNIPPPTLPLLILPTRLVPSLATFPANLMPPKTSGPPLVPCTPANANVRLPLLGLPAGDIPRCLCSCAAAPAVRAGDLIAFIGPAPTVRLDFLFLSLGCGRDGSGPVIDAVLAVETVEIVDAVDNVRECG